MKKNQLPTASDLVFRDFAYSDKYPAINCCMCGTRIKSTGGSISDVQLATGDAGVLSLAVCGGTCLAELKGPKAGKVSAFIVQEAGRLRRLFPKKDTK